MQVTAAVTNVRTSPRKLRLVADLVRPLQLDQALATLKHLRKRAAPVLLKVLRQAQANAVNNFNLAKDKLRIKTVEINGGTVNKRWQAVSKGRGHSIKKRTSNIKIVLEAQPEADKHGAKS